MLAVAVARPADADPTFTWTAAVTSGVAITTGQPIPIDITVGPVPASSPQAQVALIDSTSKQPLSNGGTLFLDPGGKTPANSLPANAHTRVWLQTTAKPGSYTGTMTISAKELPAGTTLGPTTFYVSSTWLKAGGVVAIATGVALSWFIVVFLRNLANRNQLLLPATLLVSRLEAAQKLLDSLHLDDATPNTTAKIEDLLDNVLTKNALEAKGLPSLVPSLSGPGTANASVYQATIAAVEAWTVEIEVIVSGFQKVVSLGAADPSSSARVAPCVKEIDAIITQSIAAQDPSQVLAQVNAALQRAAAPAPVGAGVASSSAVALPTSTQLLFTINAVNLGTWVIIALVTVLVGSSTLIFSANGAGFGSWLDYAQCLFWGLGLPTGASLLQNTTSSVNAAFNVSK
jgi:hypothetical protein